MTHLLIELDPKRLDDFAMCLGRQARVRVDRTTLWSAFAEAFPGRPQGPEERQWLLQALHDLQGRGFLKLPAPRSHLWDHNGAAAVPSEVRLQRHRPSPPTAPWRSFPWEPRLQWVAELPTLSADQEQFLYRVQQGLVHGWFTQPAPFKYRSLQLTSHEKRLKSFAKSRLFAKGRLSLELLGCSSEILPLCWERVGTPERLIIFENAAVYSIARSVLRSLHQPPYGLVAYGAGNRITASLADLLAHRGQLEAIDYVGDLDRDGLRIALAVHQIARSVSLPAVHPASVLHRAMLESSHRLGAKNGWPHHKRRAATAVDDGRLVEFLDPDLRPAVSALLIAGRRIPEEVLGPDEMRILWTI